MLEFVTQTSQFMNMKFEFPTLKLFNVDVLDGTFDCDNIEGYNDCFQHDKCLANEPHFRRRYWHFICQSPGKG